MTPYRAVCRGREVARAKTIRGLMVWLARQRHFPSSCMEIRKKGKVVFPAFRLPWGSAEVHQFGFRLLRYLLQARPTKRHEKWWKKTARLIAQAGFNPP